MRHYNYPDTGGLSSGGVSIAVQSLRFHILLIDPDMQELFKDYYNHSRTHASLDGNTPAVISGDRVAQLAPLNSYAWKKHCGGLFQPPVAA